MTMLARLFTAGALLAAALPLSAQTPTSQDFARWEETYEVTLSPDGKYIAMTVPTADNRETQLQVVALDGSGATQMMRFGKMEHVSSIVWTGDDRITLARASNKPLEPRPYSRGQLFSTDRTGKNQKILFGYFRDEGLQTAQRKDRGFASVLRPIPEKPGKALVAFSCWDCGVKPELAFYEVDTVTGERRELERLKDASGYEVDRNGRARVLVRTDEKNDDEPILFYRPTPDADWLPMPKTMAGRSIGSLSFAKDNNIAYAAISDHGEPETFYKLDFKAGTRTPVVPGGRPGYDIATIFHGGFEQEPFAVYSNASKPSIQYLDTSSEWTKLHAGLMKLFPGQLVAFEDFTRDNNKVLFKVWSDRNPGAWYLLDRSKGNSTQLVAQARSWLKPEQLAPMIPFEFKTRDGRTLSGFATAPGGKGPRPMVVMPHGGPHGPYDRWGYNSDAQFLASRGYSVLQVNFRGSGGRGDEFERLGYREWGGKMQEDIADGVQWAIDNHIGQSGRICTYGGSYGGYAALMQVIRFPEIYKCAIGYVGVYDLSLMHRAGDIPDTESGRRYLKRVLGTDQAVLAANSPAKNVDKIRVPVFLAQGAIDDRVPMDQFKALKSAMESKGVKVDSMIGAGEGHGFYDVKNRQVLYDRMAAFLDANIGAK